MNKTDYILKYFESTLSEAELKAFNALLINDTDFKKEFEFQKELQDTLVLNDREQQKKEIQNWDTIKNKYHFRSWHIAASFIILLGTSWLLFFNTQSKSTEDLYASYFEPYRNIVQPIVRGEQKEDIKSKAFAAYEMQNYKEALEYFNQLLKESPDETIEFYKANTLLKLNKIEEAVSIFKNNLKTKDSLDAKNNWYLALAYLKIEDIENAKKQLNSIVLNSLNDYKKEEANTILKQLE